MPSSRGLNIIAGYAGMPLRNIVFFASSLLRRASDASWGLPGGRGDRGRGFAGIFAGLLGMPILRLRGIISPLQRSDQPGRRTDCPSMGSFTGGKGITLPLPKMEIQHFYLLINFIMFGLLLLTWPPIF